MIYFIVKMLKKCNKMLANVGNLNYNNIKRGTKERKNKMMNVKVKVYNECKYNKTSEKIAEIEYYNIRSFEIVDGEKATEIANETDADGHDEFNEYLIIELENGETATFRNSHVDLFKI